MKRTRLKIKANKSGKSADRTAYKTQTNLVVNLNKEAKKSFLKNQIQKLQTKRKIFGNYANLFSLKKVFIINRNLLLKLRGVTSSETIIANIFNNYFVNITESLNMRGILKTLEIILISRKFWKRSKVIQALGISDKRLHLTPSLVFDMYYHGKRTKLLWN